MNAMLHLPYADYTPTWPRDEADELQDAISCIMGLARVGYAASDSANQVDLTRSGYEQLFQTIATVADGMFDPLEIVAKRAKSGIHSLEATRTDDDGSEGIAS